MFHKFNAKALLGTEERDQEPGRGCQQHCGQQPGLRHAWDLASETLSMEIGKAMPSLPCVFCGLGTYSHRTCFRHSSVHGPSAVGIL